MTFITDSRGGGAVSSTLATTVGHKHRDAAEISLLHIILITFGGVVFVIGIIFIVVLLKSRKKFCENNDPINGRSLRQAPVFVVGQTNRQRRGGDNPAFCRTEEGNNGNLPFSRAASVSASQNRLPTYEEVMSCCVRNSILPGSPQRSTIRVTDELQHGREAALCEQEAALGRRSGTPPPRYAYEYPSCFWEEVPPPPYSAGICGIVRAMGGARRQIQEPAREDTSGGNNSPLIGRAPLAVPTPTVLSPVPSPALPSRNHALTSSARAAVPSSTITPMSLPALSSLETIRPLASSSPAVPRRQLTPAVTLLPRQLEYVLSVGGLGNSTPLRASHGFGAELHRSQSHRHENVGLRSPSARRTPSAPIARFDIEL